MQQSNEKQDLQDLVQFWAEILQFWVEIFCSFLTRRKSMSNHDSRDETVRQELRLDNQFSAVNQQSVYHLFFSSSSSTLIVQNNLKTEHNSKIFSFRVLLHRLGFGRLNIRDATRPQTSPSLPACFRTNQGGGEGRLTRHGITPPWHSLWALSPQNENHQFPPPWITMEEYYISLRFRPSKLEHF